MKTVSNAQHFDVSVYLFQKMFFQHSPRTICSCVKAQVRRATLQLLQHLSAGGGSLSNGYSIQVCMRRHMSVTGHV